MKEKEVEEFYKSESDHSDGEFEPNTVPAASENQETSADCPSEDASKAPEPVNADSVNPDSEKACTAENTENVSAEHEPMDTTSPPEIPTERIDPDIVHESEPGPAQEKQSSNDLLENSSQPQPQIELPEKSTSPESTSVLENMSVDTPEAIESTSNPVETSCLPITPNEPPVQENTPTVIPDSVDFELRLEDSYNDTETAQQSEPPASENQPAESTATEPSTDNFPPIESNTSTVPRTSTASSRLERTLALLSNHKIDLPTVRLNSSTEEIQFEIPCTGGIRELKEKFVKHSMAKNKPKKTKSQIKYDIDFSKLSLPPPFPFKKKNEYNFFFSILAS